jgi:hypothetical protein
VIVFDLSVVAAVAVKVLTTVALLVYVVNDPVTAEPTKLVFVGKLLAVYETDRPAALTADKL